jgi:hypothetical protein
MYKKNHNLLVMGGLVAVALAMPVSAQKTVLKWQEQPLYGTQTLAAGFEPDPVQVAVRAGGSTEVPGYLGTDCAGFVNAERPDVDLNYSGGGPYKLFIYTVSTADTTLVVNMPDGTWRCNDDAGGKLGDNALITLDPGMDGNYNIWVGVYGSAGDQPATLYISERDPFR